MLISLGHLAGQLGGFVGESESVKKAVEKAIKACFDINPDLKKDLKNLYSSHVTTLSESDKSGVKPVDTDEIGQLKSEVSQKIDDFKRQEKLLDEALKLSPNDASKADQLDKLHSKLAALRKVEKLCEFYENVSKPSDMPKNLLDNLCSGLETFLGFNKDSKGYDGSGIVYSDLDRLCDAVMGFLSGVLEAVKNENEVTTYDKNEDKNINTVISTLTTNIGSGRKGLVESVDAVKKWLEGYEKSVKQKCEDVKTPLGIIKIDMNKYDNYYGKQKNRPLQEQQNEWIRRIGFYVGHAEEADKTRKTLDSALSKKLETPVKVVEEATKLLYESAKNNEVMKQAMAVDGELLNQKEKLDEAIKKKMDEIKDTLLRKKDTIDRTVKMESEDLRGKLAAEFNGFRIKLGEVKGTQNSRFKIVKSAISDAKAYANELLRDFDTQYKIPIQRMFDDLRAAVTQIDPDNPGPMNNSILKTKFSTMKQEMNSIGRMLDNENEKLQDWIQEASRVVEEARTKCDAVAQELDSKLNKELGAEIANITSRAKHLNTSYAKTKQKLEEVVVAAKTAHSKLTSLHSSVNTDVPKTLGGYEGDAGNGWQLNEIETFKRHIQNKIIGQYFDDLESVDYREVKQGGTIGNLDDKVGKHFKEWLEKALSSTFNSATMQVNLNFLKTKRVVDALSPSSTTAFGAMKADAQGNINDADIELGNLLAQAVKKGIDKLNSAIGSDTKITGLMHLTNKADGVDDEETKKKEREIGEAVSAIASRLEQISAMVAKKPDNKDTIKGMMNYLTIGLGDNEFWQQRIYGGTPVMGLKKISNQLEKVLQSISRISKEDANTKEIDTILQELQAVPKMVEHKRMEAWSIMGALKERLEQIRDQVGKLESTIIETEEQLHLAMGDMESAHDTAKQQVRIAVDTLKTNLLTAVHNTFAESQQTVQEVKTALLIKVREAFESVTEQVRTLFADGHKADLEALHKCVEKQLTAVKEIIETDLKTGIKGLLKRMNDNQNTLETLKSFVTPPTQPAKAGPRGNLGNDTPKKFSDCCPYVKSYLRSFLIFVVKDVEKLFKNATKDIYSPQIRNIIVKCDKLLDHIERHNYDYNFVAYLGSLKSTLGDLHPSDFSEMTMPLLAPLKAGLSAFAAQLGHAYVNRYSGQKRSDDWVVPDNSKPVDTPKLQTEQKYKLTPEGRNCAKVCLTILEILGHDLKEFYDNCNSTNGLWRDRKIHESNINGINEFGYFLSNCGFVVPSGEGKKQDGELRCSYDMKGEKIYRQFITLIPIVEANSHFQTCSLHFDKATKFSLMGVLSCLVGHLKQYYQVCHYATFTATRTPCSVYEMLQWLTGLPNNPVYLDLTTDGFEGLFEKKEEKAPESIDVGGLTISNSDDVYLDAYPEKITVSVLSGTLTHVCTYAHDLLTSILGHGHADGIYASDFSNNAGNLSYPSKSSACVDMLADMLSRLYEQLYFLFIQCSRTADNNSWRDCYYGRYVGGSDWRCNEKQCINQICDQKVNQTRDQIHEQMGDQHPTCGLKSPLQSYLEDGLQGFLPHGITSVGCGVKCSVTDHRGITCKSPLGFSNIGQIASHTQKGEHLMHVLQGFCGDAEKPLSKMCSYFLCLSQRPPQTLGDMFAFYYNLIVGWGKRGEQHKQIAFNGAVTDANFGELYPTFDVSTVFHQTAHKNDQTNGDLLCLFSCANASKSTITCGRYMKPFGINTWTAFSKKHADKYLSWVVYLTETFYNLLEKLYKECCNNCDRAGTRCHGLTCVENCKVQSYYETQESNSTPAATAVTGVQPTHKDNCKSIAYCFSTRPTLCKYGFVFKSYSNMSGINGAAGKRTCKDFCNALKNVLNTDKNKAHVLPKLVHETIPNYLWNIRSKFFWLNFTLWLLSLLYLFHIMVVRLDMLHIKSHLHSPSSHRIAAQSLLAAARVNKLNRVFYLQP